MKTSSKLDGRIFAHSFIQILKKKSNCKRKSLQVDAKIFLAHSCIPILNKKK
jgi:hypothetical protein